MNTYNLKKMCAVSVASIMCVSALAFSGCGNKKAEVSQTPDETTPATTAVSTADEPTAQNYLESIGIDTATLGINPNIIHDSNPVGFQLDMPKNGDTIAVVHTSYGDITMRLFPEQAPKTVTNFVNLAKAGKYNNSLFSKVTKDFMINGGYCGTSSYGEAFEDEFCDRLFNIRGAVAMSNTGADTNESAFFINQKTAETYKNEGGWEHLASQWDSIKTQLANYKDSNLLTAFIEKNGTNCYDTDSVPDSVKKLYEENGGNAYLDGAYNAVDRGYTVFAQVIDGMDVVDKIASAKVDKDDIPVKNIVIKSIKITQYKEEPKTQADSTSAKSVTQPTTVG